MPGKSPLIDSKRIKRLVISTGADICGIAPASRFSGAPPGFRPTDIFAGCRSVIVFAKKVPPSSLGASSCVPYTYANDLVAREVDTITLNACRKLEAMGIAAIPIPTNDPYEYWDQETTRGMGIISMRHAGYLAGLGVLGRNTLLVNRRYGNMIQIGAILIDKDLDGDPVIAEKWCRPKCSLCIDSCPKKALNGKTVNQKLCRPISNYVTGKGYTLKKCNMCRAVCPNRLGKRN